MKYLRLFEDKDIDWEDFDIEEDENVSGFERDGFRVGDRVKCKKFGDGKIIAIGETSFLVEFDEKLKRGHGGNNVTDINLNTVKGKDGHCWWVMTYTMKKI